MWPGKMAILILKKQLSWFFNFVVVDAVVVLTDQTNNFICI